MTEVDFEGARQYALKLLEEKLDAELVYHDIAHTRDDVVPAAERLAEREGITGEDLLLLRTAAYYHDIGFVEQSANHELVSVRIASEKLPDFGYSPEQIRRISGMILATRLPQTPNNILEAIMADADLDVLGRESDFWERNRDLRAEWELTTPPMNDEEWYRGQLKFLTEHTYFTEAAHDLRDAGKRRLLKVIFQRWRAARDKLRD